MIDEGAEYYSASPAKHNLETMERSLAADSSN